MDGPPYDVILDDVPYADMPDALLHQLARGGDSGADAELSRRSKVRVERMLRK